MASYAGIVEKEILTYKENEIFVARKLYEKIAAVVSEAAFYKTLERLEKGEKLIHLSKGLYYRPKKTTYGVLPITEAEIVEFYTSKNSGLVVGYKLFNSKMLTTQISKKTQVFSTKVEENKKTIENVQVTFVNCKLNNKTIPIIEALEILQNYYKIEDINNEALANYMREFSKIYDNKTAEMVLSNIKYKKSTIAFLKSFLDFFNVENSLGSHLSSLSTYQIPKVAEFYEAA